MGKIVPTNWQTQIKIFEKSPSNQVIPKANFVSKTQNLNNIKKQISINRISIGIENGLSQ